VGVGVGVAVGVGVGVGDGLVPPDTEITCVAELVLVDPRESFTVTRAV
jgi:hypothetical protein